jgi:excinuclease ABC subunit A
METKKYKLHVRVFLSKYRGYTLCPDCNRRTAETGGTRRQGWNQDSARSL